MEQASPDGTITIWLNELKAGDPAAAKPLWDGYFRRLVALARTRLPAAAKGAADEEDVALSAFASFFRAVEKGRFPRLDDRDDLWQVLFVITTRKAAALIRRGLSGKEGGGRTIQASAISVSDSAPDVLVAAAGAEPSPEFAAEVAEECRRLLGLLGEGELRTVAVAKMEGYTNEEIARQIGRSVPTVERKLALIRATWERSAPK